MTFLSVGDETSGCGNIFVSNRYIVHINKIYVVQVLNESENNSVTFDK